MDSSKDRPGTEEAPVTDEAFVGLPDEPDHEPPPATLDGDDPHAGHEVWFPLPIPDGGDTDGE